MSLDELERQTRSQRIDPKLKAAGWRVVPFVSGKALAYYGNSAAVTEFETEAGPADYAPWGPRVTFLASTTPSASLWSQSA